jgi:hypothetical protein
MQVFRLCNWQNFLIRWGKLLHPTNVLQSTKWVLLTASAPSFVLETDIRMQLALQMFLHQFTNTYVWFEILTTVVMKISIFWIITPCSPLKANQRFGRTNHLHLQVWRINQARNQGESLLVTFLILPSLLVYTPTLKMRRHSTPKCRLAFNRFRDVTSQKS